MAQELRQPHLGISSPIVAHEGPKIRRDTSGDDREGYQRIACDPGYQHFTRIPDRIIRCLEYSRLEFDPRPVRDRLLAYYLFIGVVDRALDFGNLDIGKRILESFSKSVRQFNTPLTDSTIELVTGALQQHLNDENLPVFLRGLSDLYEEVVNEQIAISLDAYIEHRKHIGSQTAELSYFLIQDLLRGNTKPLLELMKQVGEVGCLIDSVIDLTLDSRLGLLSFRPTSKDRMKLVLCALWEGAQTLVEHPGLILLFMAAIVDNVRDRFRVPYSQAPAMAPETSRQ